MAQCLMCPPSKPRVADSIVCFSSLSDGTIDKFRERNPEGFRSKGITQDMNIPDLVIESVHEGQ